MGAKLFETLGSIQQLGNGDFAGFAKNMQAQKQLDINKQVGSQLYTEIESKNKVKPEELQALKGLADQGNLEPLRASYNFLVSKEENTKKEEDRKALESASEKLIQSMGKQLNPAQQEYIRALNLHNPTASASALSAMLSKASGETAKKETAVTDLIGGKEKKAKEGLKGLQKEYGGPIPTEPSFVESITTSLGLQHPTTGLRNQQQSFEQQLKSLEEEKTKIKTGQAGRSTFSPAVPVPPVAQDTVRIQASDGSMHTLPKASLKAAQKRDPGLKIIQ
jgi:hypothetical protein